MTAAAHGGARRDDTPPRPLVWIERLKLTEFRNYGRLALELAQGPVVLTGENGAGKTNILEAVSLLAPGQGLRRAPYPDLARAGGTGVWAISADVHTARGLVQIGTGLATGGGPERAGRSVRIDRQPARGSGALADYLEMVWLTPSMDGLFAGPAGDRRRFLDRLILCFDPGYRTRLGQFERAMRQRNRLLESEAMRDSLYEGLELQMAELGTAIAAARIEAVEQIQATIAERRQQSPQSPFPWAALALEGRLENWLAAMPAVDAEDAYLSALRAGRGRDRAARRTLEGPHRSDLNVAHGPKAMPAKLCSTGEQKALLVNLVLSHAALVGRLKAGTAPIMLLDEIAAHLDPSRRAALFAEVLKMGVQAWMTGTDRSAFSALEQAATFLTVTDGEVSS